LRPATAAAGYCQNNNCIMTKLHILGNSGFIGGYLFKRFTADKQYDAAGYSSKQCDLLSPKSLQTSLADIAETDVILMAASITRLKKNSFDSMQKNILMAENVAGFIKNHPIGQLIFFSTVDVYGLLPPGVLISEKLLPDPNDYYATSKITSEYLLKKSCFNNNIPIAVLRLTGIYGPGDDGKSTIHKLIQSAMRGKVTIYGDGSNKRDFVYVEDLYKIIKLLIATRENIILNIATGKSSSIAQIVELIKTICPNSFTVEHKTEQQPLLRIEDMVYDTSLLNETFPEFRFTSLREGLLTYFNEYKKAKNGGQQ
jgi:UDP-glucose 4-epimerase